MLPGRKERSDISTARSAWRRPFRGSSICVATAHGPNVALLECQTAHEPRLRASATRLDRASASGADPATAEIPENPVVVETIEGQHRSQRVTKRLAEPKTAGSTAGRDWVAAGHAARVRSVRQDRAHRALRRCPQPARLRARTGSHLVQTCSPRARGSPRIPDCLTRRVRSIPACAGQYRGRPGRSLAVLGYIPAVPGSVPPSPGNLPFSADHPGRDVVSVQREAAP